MFDLACRFGTRRALELVIQHGFNSDLDKKSESNLKFPLQIAREANNSQAVQLLTLMKAFDVQIFDDFIALCRDGEFEESVQLLEKYAREHSYMTLFFEGVDDNEMTIVHHACKSNNTIALAKIIGDYLTSTFPFIFLI